MLSALEQQVVDDLRGRGERLESLLTEMVAISTHTADHEGVNVLGRLVEQHLMATGLRVGAFVTGASGQHVIGRTGVYEGNRLLLLGHLDTVYPAGAEAPAVREDPEDPTRLLGPGVTDMKGGLAVMLGTLEVLAAHGLLEGRSLTVLLTADEETGSPTGGDLVRQESEEHHLALVFETGSERDGGVTTFVTERKGCGRMGVTLTGVESHSGAKKHEGVSAALEMSHKIIALEALNGLTEGVTVNVGVARSGTAANTVPGRADLEIDYRFPEAEAGRDLRDRIVDLCERNLAPESGRKVTSELRPGPHCDPMPRTDAVGRMSDRIRAAGQDLGLDLEEEYRGGASDGNIAAAGCPAVDGLGTVGGKIHSSEEWVRRGSLVDRASLLAVTLLRFYEL